MASFEVTIDEATPGKAVVRLFGECDLGTFDKVDACLAEVQMDDLRSTIIDLRGLSFIDSTGIRLLLRANARVAERGDALRIIRGDASIQRVFGLTGLEDRLPFCDADRATEEYLLAPPTSGAA